MSKIEIIIAVGATLVALTVYWLADMIALWLCGPLC